MAAPDTGPRPPDPGAPARPGSGRLEVSWVDGSSAVTGAFATSPMKLLVPRPRGPSAWAYSSSFGGGLVAGDRTALQLDLADGTRAFVGTQSSTKVYRTPASACAHATRATVGDGALLVLAPDPAQPFAGSSYDQRQEFHLHPGASLALVDGFTAGRVARGERWAFDRYASRNAVHRGGSLEFLDALLLDPSDGDLAEPARGGAHGCLATLFFSGPLLAGAARAMLDDVASRPVARRADAVVCASPLAHGAVARVAGPNAESVGRELRRWLAPVAPLLGDDPWTRKW